MRIGIDASAWTNWRGFGRFTRSIIQTLLQIDPANEYVLFFDGTYDRCEGVPAAARHVVTQTTAAQSEAISVNGSRSIGDMLRMVRAVWRTPLDVFFCPSIDSYFPVLGNVARVVMIHDVIPETWPSVMLPNRASRLRRRIKVRTALHQAQVVATGSEYVRSQVAKVFHLQKERVAVIPYGVSEHFHPPARRQDAEQRVFDRHGLRRYVLHVGGFGPNKNIPRLLEAFAQLASGHECDDAMLVFVGRREGDAIYDEATEIERLLDRADLGTRVKYLGFQPDEELVSLYQAARALVLPSLVEGFGLPALEAVACGTPAIVTSVSPLPEVLGSAALVVNPVDTPALVSALRRVLTHDDLAHEAAARGGQFGWEPAARAALNAIDRALRRRD